MELCLCIEGLERACSERNSWMVLAFDVRHNICTHVYADMCVIYTCEVITFYKLWTFPLLNTVSLHITFGHHGLHRSYVDPSLRTPMAPVANQGNWIGRWCPSVGSSLGETEKEWPKLATPTQLMRRWDKYLLICIYTVYSIHTLFTTYTYINIYMCIQNVIDTCALKIYENMSIHDMYFCRLRINKK